MRVLVCGGRDFTDVARLCAALNPFFVAEADLIIICGFDPDDDKFQGADQLAYEWAKRLAVPVMTFPAPWSRRGRAAGPIRNSRMLTDAQPEKVVALPGGRGTADMVGKARRAGVEVIEP